MDKIKITIIFLTFFLLTACRSVTHYNNRAEDLEAATRVIDNFFLFEQKGKNEDLFKLFTLGNSGLTQNQLNDKISKILGETKLKDGFVTKRIYIKTTSSVQESSSEKTGEYYVVVINARSIMNSKETFKLMLVDNSIKIYDYQIMVRPKS